MVRPTRVTDSANSAAARQPQCCPPMWGGASTGAIPKVRNMGSKEGSRVLPRDVPTRMVPRDSKRFPREPNRPPVCKRGAMVPRATARPECSSEDIGLMM